jgi:hypothetical protein
MRYLCNSLGKALLYLRYFTYHFLTQYQVHLHNFLASQFCTALSII